MCLCVRRIVGILLVLDIIVGLYLPVCMGSPCVRIADRARRGTGSGSDLLKKGEDTSTVKELQREETNK